MEQKFTSFVPFMRIINKYNYVMEISFLAVWKYAGFNDFFTLAATSN